jgi:hypothetical protein
MRGMTPQKLLSLSLTVVFIVLVVPLYAIKGLSDSLDHARGTGTVGGIDFKAYYIAADMLRAGKDFYDVEQQAQEVQARGLPLNESYYIYPPLLAILFVPMTVLPMESAAQAWFFLNMALYGACLAVLTRALRLGRHRAILPLLWILAFLFPPALYTLYKGQVNIVVLFLLCLLYYACSHGRAVFAGLTLGLASMIKVVPVLLLPLYLWKRQYLLGVTALVTIAVIAIVGFAMVGAGPHQTYLYSVLPRLAKPRPNPANQSLGGFFGLLFIANPYSWHVVNSPSVWNLLTGTTSAAVLGALAFLLFKQGRAASNADLEFGVVMASLPLISNIAWIDMFVLLVFPYAVLCKYALDRRLARGWVTLTALSAALISFPRLQDLINPFLAAESPLIRNPLVMGLPLYGAVILWLTTAATLWVAPREENPLAAA